MQNAAQHNDHRALQANSGCRHYATVNYGIMYTAKGVASLLVPLGNVLTHFTGSWHAVYTVGCLMSVVAALLGFFVLRPVINTRLKRASELAVVRPPRGMTFPGPEPAIK